LAWTHLRSADLQVQDARDNMASGTVIDTIQP